MACFTTLGPLGSAAGCDGASGGESMTALRAPGRPKDLEKRCAILDAAQALFAERGIDGAPIEAIAARSGVSKVTVYGHFGDKASIFEALVARETDRFTERLAAATQGEGTLESRLTQLGETVISMMMEPCHLALDRIVALEAQRNPEAGRRFYDNGPGLLLAHMRAVLAEGQANGEIGAGDPSIMARDLMSLWFGFQAIQQRFCGGCVPPESELRDRVTHAVRLLRRAYPV